MKDTAISAKPEESGAQLAPITTGASALFRQATDVAHVCREIVLKCVIEIAGRRYVRVEGWMAIANAFECMASIRTVENLEGEGVRAIAEIVRSSDQAVLASAEGFVGTDEPDWYGGQVTRLDKKKRPPVERTFDVPKRANHAIRAMAQTRAISRVLRAGYSHVIVLIDHKLSTVPAEEVLDVEAHEENDADDRPTRPERVPPDGGGRQSPAKSDSPAKNDPPAKAGDQEKKSDQGEKADPQVPRDEVIALREQFRGRKWEKLVIHFGNTSKGKALGELTPKSLKWWITDWQPRPLGNRPISEADLLMRAALDVAGEETADEEGAR